MCERSLGNTQYHFVSLHEPCAVNMFLFHSGMSSVFLIFSVQGWEDLSLAAISYTCGVDTLQFTESFPLLDVSVVSNSQP